MPSAMRVSSPGPARTSAAEPATRAAAAPAPLWSREGPRGAQFRALQAAADRRPTPVAVAQRIIGHDAPTGTRVVNKTTRNVFITLGPEEGGAYSLEHTLLQKHFAEAKFDDPAYDVFAPPDRAPQGGPGARGPAPPSTSDAYETARKKEIDTAWPKIQPQVQEIKRQAIALETSKPGSVSFYNAAGLGSYTLHQAIQAIYEAIQGVRVRNHVFLRAPGNEPREGALGGPQTFLDTRAGPVWSDHSERASLLSASLALSASVADSAESTFSILQSGGLFDVDPRKTVEIVTNMLVKMGVSADDAKPVLVEVDLLAKAVDAIKRGAELKGGAKESVLYQTFIPQSLVSKLVYIAQKNGHPLDYQYEFVPPDRVLKGVAAAGRKLENGAMAAFGEKNAALLEQMGKKEKKALFQGSEFTQMVLDAAKSPAFWAALEGQNDPQARILMNPRAFVEPSGLVETVTHHNLSPETAETIGRGTARIRAALPRPEILRSVTDMMAACGDVFVGFRSEVGAFQAMPLDKLQAAVGDMRRIYAAAEARVQAAVWDYIGAHEHIKRRLDTLQVRCRGEMVDFDIDVPMRMLPNELEALIAQLKTLGEPVDLLT